MIRSRLHCLVCCFGMTVVSCSVAQAVDKLNPELSQALDEGYDAVRAPERKALEALIRKSKAAHPNSKLLLPDDLVAFSKEAEYQIHYLQALPKDKFGNEAQTKEIGKGLQNALKLTAVLRTHPYELRNALLLNSFLRNLSYQANLADDHATGTRLETLQETLYGHLMEFADLVDWHLVPRSFCKDLK